MAEKTDLWQIERELMERRSSAAVTKQERGRWRGRCMPRR